MQMNAIKINGIENLKVREIKGLLTTKILQAQEKNIRISIEVPEPIDKIDMPIVNLSRLKRVCTLGISGSHLFITINITESSLFLIKAMRIKGSSSIFSDASIALSKIMPMARLKLTIGMSIQQLIIITLFKKWKF